eukprot:CAMPEP_0181500626 /NCGR_PEP_ID=MMETSP1110-20121109/55326_2 /TAXON_ID=174948 /ORGANISM="Symbiodinium sp., Strain CCMP421" /LENGTH=99 /DNA_ID=CAMNT_0023628959 /DNA_START=458 /DNA_END=754 /DNA_ORIENTATION=-
MAASVTELAASSPREIDARTIAHLRMPLTAGITDRGQPICGAELLVVQLCATILQRQPQFQQLVWCGRVGLHMFQARWWAKWPNIQRIAVLVRQGLDRG